LIVPLLIVGVWPWGERIAFDFVLLSKASRLSCAALTTAETGRIGRQNMAWARAAAAL